MQLFFTMDRLVLAIGKRSFKEELGLVCTKANAKRQAPLKV